MKKIIYYSLIGFFGIFLFSHTVLAATCSDQKGACSTMCTSKETLVTADDCIGLKNKCCVKNDDATGTNTNTNNSGFGFDKVAGVAGQAGYNSQTEQTLEQRISSVISVALSLLGVIFMILMIYGGYTWMTAQGDEQKVDKAKDIIRAAIIGLIVVVAAYAISILVVSRVWGTTDTSTK